MQQLDESTLTIVFKGTPPDYSDAVLEIRSPCGMKGITSSLVTEKVSELRELEIAFTRLVNLFKED
jgi:hypothetical protein